VVDIFELFTIGSISCCPIHKYLVVLPTKGDLLQVKLDGSIGLLHEGEQVSYPACRKWGEYVLWG
jgi:hypothetical protein